MITNELSLCMDSYEAYLYMWKNKEITDRDFFVRLIEISYNIFRLNEPTLASGIMCDITADYLSNQFVYDCLADPIFSQKSDFVYKQLVKHGYIQGSPSTNMSPALA